jgi:Planctomycete cytochrome C
MPRFSLALALAALTLGAVRCRAQDAVSSYVKDIRPFLDKYCVQCHKSTNAKAGLNLESYQSMLKGSKKGRKALVAGKPDESRLVTTTEGKSRPIMPPRNAKLKPTEKEVAQLRAWVAAGARDDTPAGVQLDSWPTIASVPEGRQTVAQHVSAGLETAHWQGVPEGRQIIAQHVSAGFEAAHWQVVPEGR